MTNYPPRIINILFPKRSVLVLESWLFEELFGEDRLPYFPMTMAARRHEVTFRFHGWRNIDRLINEPKFRELARQIVGNNMTFGYFAFPFDIGTQALLRAWWLDKNPDLNLKDHYPRFVKDATRHMFKGLMASFNRINPPGLTRYHLEYLEEQIREDLIEREGRLNLQFKK